ncbi:MAG: GNAT family N-acetyltransferase [Bacteroidia bacterium]
MYTVRHSSTPEQFKKIFDLRVEVLRKPWNQPGETATDVMEGQSINAYIENESGGVIACGRLQENENKVGQIRFMAVSDLYRGKGLGRLIVSDLEQQGKLLQLKKIELQARENAVEFYKSCGYSVKEKSFLLWGIIQHYLMEKNL